MIVDTSALVAIVAGEPDADDYVRALADAEGSLISQGSLVELSLVLWRRFGATEVDVRAFLAEFGIEVAPGDADQAWAAAEAYRRWGPTSGTGARLNLGDCFSYALAQTRGETLLYKGDDFTRTNLRPALATRR